MPLILGTNSIKDTGFDVANSARFNSGSSDSLTRTQSASPTHDDKGTLSFWFKRSLLGVDQYVFSVFQDSNNRMQMNIKDDDQLKLIQKTGGSTVISLITNRVFRDVSAWYHVVVSIDTTQGTASNRIKIYINGVQETSFGTETYPDQNENVFLTKGTAVSLGAYNSGAGNHTSAYFSEIVMVDGQQLDATSFGEFDEDSGIWKPIDVSGLTFGTNGFYLDFEDSSALGNDAAGSNNFTVNNLTAVDQSIDTCTNNHAVGNPLLNYNPNLSEGNLVLTSSGTAWKNSMSTIGVSSGIWYHEVKITAESGVPYQLIGVTDSYHPNSWGASPPNYLGIGALQIGYYNDNGTYYQSDGQQSYSGNGFGVNDTIGVLLDLDAGTPTIKFYKNDADQGSINLPTSSNSTGLWFFMQSMYISTCSVNYGSPAHAITSGNQDGNGYGNFEFATKGGYTLNTKNLAEFG